MDNISINQALSIWDELWQAYYGKNGFGSDTAEIYAYRLMPNVPTLNMQGETFKESNKEAYDNAKSSLCHLLEKFGHENHCQIIVDGKLLRRWVETEPFEHRCHVQIKHLDN